MKRLLAMTLACAAGLAVRADAGPAPGDEPVIRALKDELARSMAKLEMRGFGKPYYLAYSLLDGEAASAHASFGALTASGLTPVRVVTIDLRVGDYAFDNGNFADAHRTTIALPRDDDYDDVRRAVWLGTDDAYKQAVEQLDRKKAVAKQEAKSGDVVASFSAEPLAHAPDAAPPAGSLELAPLEQLVTKLSGALRGNPDIYDAAVTATAVRATQTFLSSEGGFAARPYRIVQIDVAAHTQAADGMPLGDALGWLVPTLDQLPREADMVARVEALSRELTQLRAAPILEDYAGPVLFDGVAAGQIMRVLLATNLGGTPAPKGDRPGSRESGESELFGKLGQRVLPAGVTVIDDPGLESASTRDGKIALVGAYKIDDEGVAAQRVSLIENGKLVRFLMSRTPRPGFAHSNGHGRASLDVAVRAMPSNLVVSAAAGLGDPDIRRRAIAVAKDQGLPYVMVVDRLVGFTPAVVERVYLDGHSELVRGASLGAMPTRELRDIIAVGARPTAYQYMSSVPVAILAPPLLFRDLDLKKPTTPQPKPPSVTRPR